MNLKEMDVEQLKTEAETIRKTLIDVVSANGGHLAPNLGVVELTLALHKVFDSPKDKILFDVGHQSYVHKLLTGREGRFHTLRKLGGIGPFMDPGESDHDPFITGHAGSALSAACGLAVGDEKSKVISIVGDASISNGHSLEALNNIGGKVKNLIVVLNDNEMSIGENVGSLSKFFGKLMVTKTYMNIKDEVTQLINRGRIGSKLTGVLKRAEHSVKHFLAPLSISEDLGFKYIGVIDGHNLEELIETFEKAKEIEGPVFVHIKTNKGKGYAFAEENQEKFHGISPFDADTGRAESSGDSYSKIFGDTFYEMAKKDERVMAISAGMVKGTGLSKVFEAFPERTFDVGITEGHAVTFAGGLAVSGKKPYVAIYSTFMQRAYGQLIHDISLQNLPVRFIVDRAGIVGADGKTHQGIYDIGFFTGIPNFTVVAPTTCRELEEILEFSRGDISGPLVIRIPRASCFYLEGDKPLTYGKWKKLYGEEPQRVRRNLFIVTGSMLQELLAVKPQLEERGIEVDIVSAAFISPMDTEFLLGEASKYEDIFVLEEGYSKGSFGTSVVEFFNDNGILKKIHKISLDTGKIPHGEREELMEIYGLRGESLIKRIEGCLDA